MAKSGFQVSGRYHAIKVLLKILRAGIGELVIARRDFGDVAQDCPIRKRQGDTGGSQSVKPRRITPFWLTASQKKLSVVLAAGMVHKGVILLPEKRTMH
jgi:hypothetical protein